MIYLFHGDNQVGSRNALHTQVETERVAGHSIQTVNGEKATAPDLESSLNTANLFDVESLVIENLLTRLRSKEKDRCIEIIGSYKGNKNILLWEKKAVTKAAMAKLGSKVVTSESKAPQVLFAFLDTLIPGNTKRCLTLLHELAGSTDEILIFTMIARHVANLITAESTTSTKLAPWQLGKLRAQAKGWETGQLIHFHDELLAMDLRFKSGATKLGYLDSLDMLLPGILG